MRPFGSPRESINHFNFRAHNFARAFLVRGVALTASLLTALLVGLLVSCGPIKNPPQTHFVCVVHNFSAGPDKITIRSALNGIYQTSLEQEVPANSDGVWILGTGRPDLIEVASTGLNTAYGPPDWSGGCVFVVAYPYGYSHSQEWPPRNP